MKTELYLFTYSYEGKHYEDYVVAKGKESAERKFKAWYSNVTVYKVELFGECLT